MLEQIPLRAFVKWTLFAVGVGIVVPVILWEHFAGYASRTPNCTPG